MSLLNKRIPTIVGIILLISMIVVGIILVSKDKIFSSQNKALITPAKITVSNIQDTQFTVSWSTQEKTTGNIKYSDNNQNINLVSKDERDERVGEASKFSMHYITIKGLQPTKAYYFKIGSGNSLFDNDGKPYTVTTGPALESSGEAKIISGRVLKSDNSSADGVLVYLSAANMAILSSLTDKEGRWAIFLNKARNSDLSAFANIDPEATILKVEAQSETLAVRATTITKNAFPVPDIVLGHTPYDFREKAIADQPIPSQKISPVESASPSGKLSLEKQEQVPFQAPAQPSEDQNKSSQFDLNPLASTKTPTTAVTIDNPAKDGEQLNTLKPEFLGKGPVNKVLTIKVESPTTITKTITVDKNGSWQFSPLENLAPGNHTINVSYLDSDGKTKTISKKFVVMAAGTSKLPSLEATASGTKVSPSPKTPRISMPATDSGVPKTGTMTPTFIMLAIGLLLISLSFINKLFDINYKNHS